MAEVEIPGLESKYFQALSESIVNRHYQLNKQLEQAYGPGGRQKCLDDAVTHLTYLGQAVENKSEQLFIDYILWAETLFKGINLPISHLKEHLKVMAEVLSACLPEEQSESARSAISAALSQLGKRAEQKKSFLCQEEPLYELAREYLDDLLLANRVSASQRIMKAVQQDEIPVRDIYLQVFQPCQREVGLLWQTGKISVAQEHFCTAVTQLCMSQLYPYIFAENRSGHVAVITCAQGELHEIGVRMVADLLEMNGWDAFYLGANTPVQSVLEFVEEKQPELVGISATITANLTQVKGLIAQIRQLEKRQICIMVGGYPFNVAPDLWRELKADAYANDAQSAIDTVTRIAEGQ